MTIFCRVRPKRTYPAQSWVLHISWCTVDSGYSRVRTETPTLDTEDVEAALIAAFPGKRIRYEVLRSVETIPLPERIPAC